MSARKVKAVPNFMRQTVRHACDAVKRADPVATGMHAGMAGEMSRSTSGLVARAVMAPAEIAVPVAAICRQVDNNKRSREMCRNSVYRNATVPRSTVSSSYRRVRWLRCPRPTPPCAAHRVARNIVSEDAGRVIKFTWQPPQRTGAPRAPLVSAGLGVGCLPLRQRACATDGSQRGITTAPRDSFGPSLTALVDGGWLPRTWLLDDRFWYRTTMRGAKSCSRRSCQEDANRLQATQHRVQPSGLISISCSGGRT
jgi:hypothetical protein